MDEKEVLNQETNENELEEVKEEASAVEETKTEEAPAEEKKDEFDSSIEITKPTSEEKPYYEVVEEERLKIIALNKKGQVLSTISVILVLGLSIGGIFTLQTIPVLSYVLMGLAIVVLITFSILNHRVMRPDVKGYVVAASTAINKYVFADTRYSEVKYDPNDKLELQDVSSDGVYDQLVRTASRNVVEGKYDGRTFKVCECALFRPNVKGKQDPAFIGKYLTYPNSLHFEGRLVIVSKGEKDIDIPNGLGDLNQLENDEKFFIYGSDEKLLKDIDKKFINEIKRLTINNHMLNLTIAIWSGRTIVYASYDDATITLPFYEKYQEDTAKQYREDLLTLLEALTLLNKE